jgi:hypothetical protein
LECHAPEKVWCLHKERGKEVVFMQMDFHFYAIYALARATGFIPGNAHIIAYASQHTDDAKYKDALEFENGGRFQQVLTAHKLFDPGAINKETCYSIWVPFHFLPGNVGVDFYERMLARSGSTIVQRLVDDLVASNSKPYILHRFGILLHTYADTWSHQNFLGLIREDLNDVRRLDVAGETKRSLMNPIENGNMKMAREGNLIFPMLSVHWMQHRVVIGFW